MIIDLRNGEDRHLGFVLFAISKETSDFSKGDCVIRALPKERELFQTEEFHYLDKLKNYGELPFHHDKVGGDITIGAEDPVLKMNLKEDNRCSDVVSQLTINGRLIQKKKKS